MTSSDNFIGGDSGEEEQYENLVNFSGRYQFRKLFHTIQYMQSTQQYSRARRIFYDGLGWFAPQFDETFPVRCKNIENRYAQESYLEDRTYEQIEELKYMRTVTEFVRMLWDATTRHKRTNTDMYSKTQAVPIGFGGVIDTEQMSVEFFNRLVQVQQQQHSRDVERFFYHGLSWFGSIFDVKFITEGYIINALDAPSDTKFKKLVTSFSKLLTRRSVLPSPFASMVYQANPDEDIPHSVSDIVRRKAHNNKGNSEALKNIMQNMNEAETDEF